MIKVPTHQEDITILNMYVPNNKNFKIHEAKTEKLKGKGDKSTIIAGDFKTPLLVIYRMNR